MNYSGNMPDWHQYNPPQSGINDVTSTAQNVNSGHLSFISSISPSCPTQLNGLNLSSEGLEKHQNDSNFNQRHFQPHLSSNITHGHNATESTPLASMVQMQNCIGHYGPSNTRNSMVENLNGPMDPRNTAIGGLNEELGYRNNQVPLNGPISHLNGPNVINMNAPHASIGARNTNVNSHATNRTVPPPSFIPCKGLCCNPDPNISYQQWEKYCSYQNNTTYRENIRSSAGYQADARRAFGSDFNFRKDNFDSKEVLPSMVPPPNAPNADHRRNFTDFKYRKDRLLSRNYPPSSSMLQNYPMQNYNYTGEYQKYSYNVKEYSKVSGMNVPNQGMVKHQEQGFAMPQQKYNNKQVSYQNSGGMMPSSMPSTSVPNQNMIPSAQNTYFNSQYPRNLSTNTSHDCQEAPENVSMVNRMQTSTMHTSPYTRYQVYQQKIAMQRFSAENHLRELSRIPGYESHPKYKEYAHRYREILKLQQSVTYQGQIQQTPPCVTASTVNTSTVPPINLQFDQNGVLINSNYMPEAFPRMQQVVNPQAPVDSSANKQDKQNSNNVPEMVNHHIQKSEQLVSQQHLCPGSIQKQDRYPVQKSIDQSQFEVQKTGSENFNNLSTNTSDAAIQQRMPKQFADKPELDVRQFLANWDESEDEDNTSTNLPNAILSDSTPVMVVGYENVDLSTKTLESLESSKPEEIASSVITFENQNKSNNSVVSSQAQDCLTISYSSAEDVEIAKDTTCKEITKESIVRPGSHIIQCISNGPDDVPTIHIVDNLEIGSILQVTNGQVTETLERQDAVSFFPERSEVDGANAITLETNKFEKTDNSGKSTITEYNPDLENLSKDKYVEDSSPKTVKSTSQTSQVNNQEIATLPTSVKDNLDSGQDINLKKQSSFASEESHNPDDISLPDLPTSECTPISTTLNTPIHSDSEESSERVEDLTIPTNPIEIIQNSPMISFTQSPTKGEPYDHLSDEGTVRNKSTDSLEGEYQSENRFKNDGSNNMLDHDTVLATFEFPTHINKNNSTMIMKNDKEHISLSGNSASVDNNTKTFDGNIEPARMRMTLTSGEYELKIVPTETQYKSIDSKNSTSEHCMNESQITIVNQNALSAYKKLQVLPEANAKVALRYSDSTELDNAIQKITNNPDSVELSNSQEDINYTKRRCISTELTHQTITSINTINLSPTNDTTPKCCRPAIEDNCSTKIVRSNSSALHITKHSTSNSDKLKKCETLISDKSAKENSPSEKNAGDNKSSKIDIKDLKNSRHMKHPNHKKSISSDQTISHKKGYLPEGTAEKCNETILHHNKHTQEVVMHKGKFSIVENPKEESNITHNKPRVIANVSIDDSAERMRLLKEYRRMKYKSNVGEIQKKSIDTQEASDYTMNKKCHLSSNPDEQSVSQLPSDKQICQKNIVRFNKSSEEQERESANILKTFVTKNINPDFAIQFTNVNLKLKDNDHLKDSQHLGEEAKNSGSLDGIKIEINVSCAERNTTEKLLHENIKNAVAETIGHLTSSISNGARSNSTSITEIHCDKKITCDKVDHHDYERCNRSPAALMEIPTCNEVCENQTNTEVKHELAATACKESTTDDELSNLFTSRKRRRSYELINDIYEEKGNINIEAEQASSSLETSKSEHIAVRRKSVHQDTERKVTATNLCEELKVFSDNLPYIGSPSKNVSIQRKHQEMASPRNARNIKDDVVSRLNAVPSTSSSIADPSLEGSSYDNPVHFDYDHFDVAPNENTEINDKRTDRWKRAKRDDSRYNNFDLYETANGYVNPTFFSSDELENLNAVPVYTTKDGKITYSPNPRFTYRELITEARAKEGYNNARESYFPRSPSYDYYNCSKLRKLFKRNRDATTTNRKREIDSADAKPAAKHIDYLSNKNTAHKNAHYAKARSTSHLEFFNDDANKLYANRSQQETKESRKKSIVDLSFLEKQYNLDSEPTSSTKHCKTKVFADNFDFEKEYRESSVFDSNLFLGPKTTCWEETMESVKSYSSHIDRRSSDSLKELNFSEIFISQKRLDRLPFLSTEQDSSDNGNHKANYNVANESILHHYTDNLNSIQDDAVGCEQSGTTSHNERGNGNNNQDNASETDFSNKSKSMSNASLDIQRNNEYAKKQESQSDETESSAIILTEKTQSCPPEVANEKIHENSEKDECPINYIKDKETSTECLIEDDTDIRSTISLKKDKSDAEDANAKQILDKSSAEVINTFKPNIVKNSPDGLKYTETVKESTLASNEQDDEINDSAKNTSDYPEKQETVHQQVTSTSIDCKNREEVSSLESNVSEISFDQTVGQDNMCDIGNSTVCREKESIDINPSDALIEQPPDEKSNEQQLQKSENEEQIAEISFMDQENDKVDNCSSAIISTSAIALDLHAVQTEKNVCDLFTNEKHEQNISEFTVIKSIIQVDKKQHEELETKEDSKDCDNIIDSKLLCMDSSDCGIYAEDRCALTQMSEHEFTEDDSMVPMEWETSQIQEDAVNRLCSIDESSIDFAGAANSLHGNSLLDHLSISTASTIKESRVSEAINEIENKSNDKSMPAIESAPVIEEFKAVSNNDENKEQRNQVSSSNYEKVAYLRSTDFNANTKMIPKLVIKKSESSSKFVTKMGSSSITKVDNIANKLILKPNCQPKIPKMIIRNARSRPGTPSIEAVHEDVPAQVNISDRSSFANEEQYDSDSESSLQESNNYRNKIPKMKIKLDEKHSNKIVRAEDTNEFCVKRKNIKKSIQKIKIKSSSKTDLLDSSVCNSTTFQESKDSGKYEEKIPVLKLRKQERNRSSSPEVTRKRPSSSHSDVLTKKFKKSGYDETGHSTRRSSSDSTRTSISECETKKNPRVCISEKIPKVIIKRTSASAEFKCELSKGCGNVIAKSAKWQPEVKLERYRILDNMVKDLKLTLSPISLRTIDKIFSNHKDGHCEKKEGDHKLSRSNSTSDLLPVKCKQRRMSDYDCRKTNDALKVDLSFTPSRHIDSRDTKTCSTPKKNSPSKSHNKSTDECQKNKRRSRSRDNNPRAEADFTSPDKETNELVGRSGSEKAISQHDERRIDNFEIDYQQASKEDEDTAISNKLGQKNIFIKHSSDSTNFKIVLKESKTTSKIEDCFVKLPDLNEISYEEINLRTDKEQRIERDVDLFLSKNESEIVIKKERLSSSCDMDNDCILQEDISSLKDDCASTLDNFAVDNSVIKIESSDESQSTIEILPASPDGNHSELENHIIEDGDSEQLYPADAIPTQFELELEITDNSNTDLLDVPMPKLDLLTCYSSRRVSTEESYNDQTLTIERYNKSELSFCGKNLLGKNEDKHAVEIDISSDDRSALENDLVGSIKEMSSKSPCNRTTDSPATKESFCCSDSLIKEVLAAKEALKKCLSKSKCESSAKSNARPKTAAEKKQGSSFDLNNFSETHSKSSVSPQGCRADVAPQKDSIPVVSKHKTEATSNVEKSDDKHSKQSKNSFVKKKLKSPENNDKVNSKEMIKDTHECTTISLKTFKRLDQATSNETPSRTIYLSEKRKKNLEEKNDSIAQLQDSQQKEEDKTPPYKVSKILKSTDQQNNTSSKAKIIKSKEDNMPILEPEVAVNFDTSSDRDSSRSPPVITIQDNEDLDIAESKLVDDKVITSDDKIVSDKKDVHKKSEMSVADFITQLAYNEKATIKHRRYCTLCERWFPTTSRHRRHLAGYQHRHIELTQRRSIHALFMLFTGKPCPRLPPANVVRNDYSVGEFTPLQIAVQDITKCFDHAQQSPRKQNDVEK